MTGATLVNAPPPNDEKVAMVTVRVMLPAGVVLLYGLVGNTTIKVPPCSHSNDQIDMDRWTHDRSHIDGEHSARL